MVRDLAATLLALAAAVMLALWAPALWLQGTIIERDGFLSVAEPLAEDADYQRTLSDAAVDGVLEEAPIPGLLSDQLAPVLQEQAPRITGTEEYRTSWTLAMEDLHATLLDPAGGTVRADLNPLSGLLLDPFNDTFGTSIEVPDSDTLRIPIAHIPPSSWPDRLQALAGTSGWIGWVGFAVAVLGIAVASHRRILTFVLGLLVALAAGAQLLVSQFIELLVPDSFDQADVVGGIIQAFEAHFRDAMVAPAMALLGAGVLLIVVALVLLSMGGRPARAPGRS